MAECIACGLTNSFIFNVRHRGIYRRFCTACILKNHSGCFCPICFDLFDFVKPLPSHQRLTCITCPSVSHLSCVHPPPPPNRYRCPSCYDPNFSFFDLPHNKSIDIFLAKQLFAAAQIASSTMTAAAASAANEADKKVEEAALTRQKAIDAMGNLATDGLLRTPSFPFNPVVQNGSGLPWINAVSLPETTSNELHSLFNGRY